MILGQAERLQELNSLRSSGITPGTGRCPIIAFTSGKGGTGKSFFTLNSAYSLAKLGKRVLVIDLDANLSNINIMLNLAPVETIYHFFSNKALLKDVITKYEPNLHFIFGDSGKGDHPPLNGANVERLMQSLRELSHQYDFVFLDTGAGAGEDVLSVLTASSLVIIVTNPEPTAVMDAYVVLKLLNQRGFKKRKEILMNKCGSLDEGTQAFNNLNSASLHFLGEPLLLFGILEHAPEVGRSILNQRLLAKTEPGSKIAKQVLMLSRKFLKFQLLANNHH